jgi:acetoacetyl-CoA synthetase
MNKVLLFLKLEQGTLSESPRNAIQSRIYTSLSPRYVPSGIYLGKDIPYMVNGKSIEKTARDIVSGKKSAVSATVASPERPEEYQHYALPFVETRSAKL